MLINAVISSMFAELWATRAAPLPIQQKIEIMLLVC